MHNESKFVNSITYMFPRCGDADCDLDLLLLQVDHHLWHSQRHAYSAGKSGNNIIKYDVHNLFLNSIKWLKILPN